MRLEFTDLEINKVLDSPEDLTCLFKTIAEAPDMRIKFFNTDRCDLTSVPPDILTDALLRVQEVRAPNITADQAQNLLTKIATSPLMSLRCLRGFRFSARNLISVPVEILIKATMKLEDTDIRIDEYVKTPEEVQCLFKLLAASPFQNMNNILDSFTTNIYDLSLVPPETGC